MSKQKKFHVEFDVTTAWDLSDAKASGTIGFQLPNSHRVYPVTENLKITELIEPLEPGYYVREDNDLIYMRDSEGRWYRRGFGGGGWLPASVEEKKMRNFGHRIAPLGMEDPE